MASTGTSACVHPAKFYKRQTSLYSFIGDDYSLAIVSESLATIIVSEIAMIFCQSNGQRHGFCVLNVSSCKFLVNLSYRLIVIFA